MKNSETNIIIVLILIHVVSFSCEGKKLPLPSYVPEIRENTAPGPPFRPNPENNSEKQPIVLTLMWKCNDPEEDMIDYAVYFGKDTADMELLTEAYPDTFWVLEDTLLRDTEYYWRIKATDIYGLYVMGPVWTFTTAAVENMPPEVSISSPADGSTFYTIETVNFSATGFDPEDGTLPSSAFNWSSDIDGFLWNGASFSTSSLSAGTHLISLRGTDSKGLEDTAYVEITLNVPPPTAPTASITYPDQDYLVFLQGQTLNFQAQGDDPFEDLPESAFAWTSSISGSMGTGKTLPVNNLSLGTHRIILEVSDNEGFQVRDTVYVSIAVPDNEKPHAYFHFTGRILRTSGTSSAEVSLDAGDSYDTEDRHNLAYKWDWDNDGTWDTDFLTLSTVTQTVNLTDDVNYIRLLVRDRQGGEDETVRIVPEMIQIPAGVFKRGSNVNEGAVDERPEKDISVSAFYMDKYEVTNSQYAVFLNDGNQDYYYVEMKINENGSGKYVPMEGYENHPVAFVNWFDAKNYCEWLKDETGLDIRLPTEAEWEKAARGGAYLDAENSVANPLPERTYPWGENFDGNKAHYSGNLLEFPETAPEGYYTGKSPYNLYDMAGNLSEWTLDYYSNTYYSTGPAVDPQGPSSGFYRVLRGGSYLSNADELRTAKRDSSFPGMRGAAFGFRCALSY